MARTDPQVNFRIPAELKDKLDEAAKENGRTLTAELILRLETTFENDNIIQDLSTRVEKLEEIVERLEAFEYDSGLRLDSLEGRH